MNSLFSSRFARALRRGTLAVSLLALPGAGLADSVEDISLLTTAFSDGRAVACNDRAYMVIDDGAHGAELWVSDGTSAGTTLLRDIQPGATGSDVRHLTVAGSVLFFTAGAGDLWRSDGTTAGTVLVKGGVVARDLAAVGGALYFSGQSGGGRTVWKSNGTTAGTVQVSGSPLDPRWFCDVNGTVFFAATASIKTGTGKKAKTTTIGEELWKTNGTAAGTVLVKDINPGFNGSSPSQLTLLNGVLYFAARTSNEGLELWRSDGTSGGTVLVKNIASGSASSNIARLRAHGAKLYFNAAGSAGLQLWESDGTAAGTVPATAFAPGVNGFIFADFAVVGSRAMLRVENANGSELWSTDGTAGGTQFLRLMVDNSPALVEVTLASIVSGNQFYFLAHDFTIGTELHVTDGTVAGTRLVKDIFPSNHAFMPPLFLTATAGRMFFAADQNVSGLELWTTDGTTAGSAIVRDFLAD